MSSGNNANNSQQRRNAVADIPLVDIANYNPVTRVSFNMHIYVLLFILMHI